MTVVKLDYDGALPVDLMDRIRWVFSVLAMRVSDVLIERTRRGWHVRIFLARRLAPKTVVCLQAVLGSDWKREAFNLARVMKWAHVPAYWRARANVLYSRHDRGGL